MCAHYLGKRAKAPLDRRRFAGDMGELDTLYGGIGGRGRERPGTRREQPGVMPGLGPGPESVRKIDPGEVTPYTDPSGRGAPGLPEEEAQPESYVDDLMASLFGKGFETIRGIGGRSQEAVYDQLARQGLLGTGAATDVAREMAWQTERGITDLIRSMGEMRADKEQEAMNMLLQLFGMQSQAWG